MDEAKKKEIVEKLHAAGVTLPCPRCGNPHFTLLDGYFNHAIHDKISGDVIIGGPTIPCVATACNRCGYISEHALGALGLLPQAKAGDAK